MAQNKFFYLDETGLGQYDALIKQYIGDANYCKILYDTTANWNKNPKLIGKRGCIYVYSDYKKNEEGQDIAGIKIGDGQAYLIDAPFTDEILYKHIEDKIIHITQAEREFWNNKTRCYVDSGNPEHLIFTTN